MPEITKTERILNLFSFLLAAGNPVPWREIREQVAGYQELEGVNDPESLRRRFERDKKELGNLGVSLEYIVDDLHEGYRILQTRSWMEPLALGAEERALLLAVARSVRTDRDNPFVRHIQSALLKLGFDFPVDSDVWDPDPGRPGRTGFAPSPETSTRNLGVLGQALSRRKKVHFLYQGYERTEPKERHVAPHGLFFRDSTWYLVGFDESRHAMRTYRVDRIRNRPGWQGDPERPEFEVSSEFNIERFAQRPPWSFRGEANCTAVTARVRFDATHFWRVCESGLARSILPDSNQVGAGVATFSVTNLPAFLRYVLAFGHHALLLEPDSLREELLSRLQNAHQRLLSPDHCMPGESE